MKREELLPRWVECREAGMTLDQAAVEIGINRGALERALARARKAGDQRAAGVGVARPLTGPDDPRHGTRYAYVHYKCRCDDCMRANREDQNRLNLERGNRGLPPGDPRHGTGNGYSNWMCRCPVCAEFWRGEMSRQYRDRTRRGLPAGDDRHGTVYGYSSWGCRCDPCRAANSSYVRTRNLVSA